MKSKKLISFLCAAAMTVSTFAGLAVTASAAETVLWSDTFDGYPNEVKSGEGGGGLPTLYPDVLVDGTTVAGNKYQFIDGVTLYTTGRGDDSSYWVSTEDANGGRAITTSTSRFARQGAGASFNFVDDDGKDKPFEATSGDLVLAFKLKLSDAGESGYDHAFALNDDTNNVVKLGDALTLDKWSDVKIVINSTGATTYVDGAVAGTTLSNVKNLSSINFDSFINGAVANDAVKTTSCPAGYPTWNIDDMVVYTSDNGAESTPPAAVTHPKKGVEFEVVPQGTLSETIEKMPVNEIAKNDFNTRGTTDSNGRYIFTGGSDTGVFSELDIVDLYCKAGGDARGESNWKPVGNTNTDPTLGTDTFLQANMGTGSSAGNGPQMVFKGYGTVNEETGLPELAEREGVSVSFAARLTKGETAPAEMIFSGSLDVSSSTYNLIYPQAMITTDKEAESSVYVVDHALSKDNVVQVDSGEWFLVTMDTYRAEGKTATATIKVTTYPKDGDPVVKEIFNGNVANATGNGINQLMSISFRAGNSDTWGVSNSKVEFDNMVIGSTSAEEKPTEAPAPTAAPVKIHDVTIAQSGQDVTVTDNDGEEDAYDAVLIHAGYDNGTLRAVKAYDIKVTDGKATQAVPAADKIYKGDKLMVWDSLKGMVPYGVYEVTDGEEAPTPSPKPTEAPTPTPGAEATPTPGAATPTPGAATPTPGAATPTPGAATPTPGAATPTPGAATPVPKPDKITKAGEATATLAYTAHSQWGSNAAGNSVNNDTEYFNNDSADAWAGAAYMQFYVPELDTGLTITKAELSFTVTQGGNSGRTSKLYIANDDIDLTADLKSSGDDLFKSARTEVSDVVTDAGGNAVKDFALDVTSAIKANSTATFILTGNAGGATIMGKPNAKAPVLKLTVADQSSMSTITIEYKTADGTALTPNDNRPLSATAEKGKAFTATDAMKAPIVVDGKKYVLTSDSATSVTPEDATATLTLTFEEAQKAPVTVKTKAGTQEDTIYTGNVYVGDSENVFYPKYIKVGNELYTKASTGGNNPGYWGVTVTPTSAEAVTQTIEYTKVENTTAVFFAEGEDEFGDANVSNQNLRCSNGKAGLPPEGTGKTIAKLPAGTYKIETAVWGGGKTEAAQSTFTISAGTALNLDVTTTGSRVENTNDGKEFTLTAETDLVVTTKTKGTSSAGVDYVLITGTTSGTVTPAITGTVTLDPAAPKAGDKVTATVEGLNDGVTAKYEWYLNDTKQTAEGAEFTIPADTAAGTKVKVVVTAEGTFGELSKEVEVAAEPEETPAPTESPAPVAPKAAAAANDANITGYEFAEAEGIVTLKGSVAKSKNGAGNDGYWIGFVVNADPGNKITKLYFGTADAPATAEAQGWTDIAKATENDPNDTATKVGFYANLGDATPKTKAAVVCADGEIYKWTMDLSGASIKAVESEATLGEVAESVEFVGGKKAAEFGTFVYTDPTKITGEAKYVEGYEAFNANVSAEQEGNYVPLRISIPAEFKGDVTKATVKYMIDRTQPTAAVEKTYSEFTNEDKNLDVIFFMGTDATTITIKIDLDGNGEEYSEKVYTIDISELDKIGKPEAAEDHDNTTPLTGTNSIGGDVLPEGTKASELGTVTLDQDEAQEEPGIIYYTASGDSSKITNTDDSKTGNYAAVTLTAPTKSATKVAVLGATDKAEAKDAEPAGDTDLHDVEDGSVTAVMKIDKSDSDAKVTAYKVIFYKDTSAAGASLASISDKYQQVGDAIVIDFSKVELKSGKVTEVKAMTDLVPADHDLGASYGGVMNTLGVYESDKTGANTDMKITGVAFKKEGKYKTAIRLTDTTSSEATVEYAKKTDDTEPDVYTAYAGAATDFNTHNGTCDIVIDLGTADTKAKYFYLKVDKDGEKTAYEPAVLKIDLSGITLLDEMPKNNISAGTIGAENGTLEIADDTAGEEGVKAYKLTATGLKKHANGAGTQGYWVGVKVKLPANITEDIAKKIKFWFADSKPTDGWIAAAGEDNVVGKYQIYKEGSDTYVAYYWNLGDTKPQTVTKYLAYQTGETYKITVDATYAADPTTFVTGDAVPTAGQVKVALADPSGQTGPEGASYPVSELGTFTLTGGESNKGTVTGTANYRPYNSSEMPEKEWYLPVVVTAAEEGATFSFKTTLRKTAEDATPYGNGTQKAAFNLNENKAFALNFCLNPVDTLWPNAYQTKGMDGALKEIILVIDADGEGDKYAPAEYTIDVSAVKFANKLTVTDPEHGEIKIGTSKDSAQKLTAPTQYEQGSTVYVVLDPAEGYKAPETFTIEGVTDLTKVDDSDNTTYTFKMPAQNVTVSAVFEKEEAKIDYATWVKSGDDVAHNEDENLKLGQISSASNPAEGTEQSRNKTDEMTLVKLSGLSTIDKDRLVSATLVASMASASYDDRNSRWGDSQIAIGVLTDNNWTEESTYSDIESAIPDKVIAGPWTPTKKTQAQGEDANGPFDTASIDITKQIKEAEGDELSIMLGLFTTRSQLIQKSSLQLNIVQGQKVDFNVTAAVGSTEIDDAVIEIKTTGGESKTVATLTTADGGKASTALEAGSYTYTVTSKDYKIKTDGTLTVSEDDVTENVSLAAKTPTTLEITSPESTVVSLDTTVQFTATVKDDDGRDMTAEEAPITWSIVDSPANITVVNGLVSATEGASGGSYQVKAELTSNGEVNDTADFTVNLSSPATLTVVYTTGTDDNGKVGEVEVYGADDSKFVNDALTEDELAAYKVPYVKKNSDSDYSVYAYKSIGEVPSQLVADTKVYITVEEPETYLLYNECNVEGASPSWWTDKSRTTAAWGSGTIKQSSENPTSYVIITNGNGQSGGVYDAITQDTTDKIVNVSFDYYLSARTNIFSVRGGTWDNNDRAFKDDKRAFSLDSQTAGQLKVVGGSSTSEQVTLTVNNSDGDPNKGSAESWIHVTAAIDCKNHTTNIKIYKYKADGNYTSESAIYENASLPFRDSSISNLTGFEYVTTSNGGQVAIDNLAVKSITDAE